MTEARYKIVFSFSTDNVDDLPMAYGDNFRILSESEQTEYNKEIATNVLRDAGIKTHSRLVSLSMKDINKIVKVVKDYKYIDKQDRKEKKNNNEKPSSNLYSFEKMAPEELEQLVFQFIAEAQESRKEKSNLNKSFRQLKKISAEQKITEEKISDIKEQFQQLRESPTSDFNKDLNNLKGNMSKLAKQRISPTILDNAVKNLIQPTQPKVEEIVGEDSNTNRFLFETVQDKNTPLQYDPKKRPKSSANMMTSHEWENIEGSTKQSRIKMLERNKSNQRGMKRQKRRWSNKPNLDKRY